MIGFIEGNWLSVRDGEPAAFQLFKRHYTYRQYKDNRRLVGRHMRLFGGPGERTILVTMDYRALFVWRKFIDDNGQLGINCAVFRNESEILSSDLIREACELAWNRWPGERLYTYVNPNAIQSTNPGYCFIKAGWTRLKERTKSGLVILEKLPD